MAATITGATIFQRVIAPVGQYIPNALIDELAAGYFVAPIFHRNNNWSVNHFHNQSSIIFRPGAASAADYVRYADDLTPSTGKLEVDTDWADVTLGSEDIYRFDGGVHPAWAVDAMNRAMSKCYFENSEPLSLAADAGFQSSATSSWVESDADGGPATTLTKVTTANSDNVFTGIGAGRVVNSATGGYIRQRFNVHPGSQVYVGALARADSGTAELVLYDVTNAALIGTAVTHDGEQWAYLHRTETIPSGCEILEVRLKGSESNADIYWNGLWVYRTGDRRIRLSTTWDTAKKIPALATVNFGESVESGVENAFSIDPDEMSKALYGFLQERVGANPYAVQLHEGGLLNRPIYIQGRRPYSDLTTFTLALTETTSVDLDLIESASRVEFFGDKRVQAKVSDWENQLAIAYGDFLGANSQFASDGPADRKQVYAWPRAGN